MGKTSYVKKKGKKTFRRKARKATGVNKVVKAIQQQSGLTVLNKTVKSMNFTRTNIRAFTLQNTAATSTQSGIIVSRFQDIPNATEFTALFDKYKINSIKYTFRMTNCPDATEEFPVFLCYKMNDPDATAAGVSELTCEQAPYLKRMQFSSQNTQFTTKVMPYWLGITYASTAVVGYDFNSAKKSSYLDTHYPNIAHYGLCWFIPSIGGSILTTWKIECDIEYNFTLKIQA